MKTHPFDSPCLVAAFALALSAVAGCAGPRSFTAASHASWHSQRFRSTVTWTFWGDSLTELGYPYFVSVDTGEDAVNEGVAAQSSTEIAAREGAVPIRINLSGDQIPTSGGVQVTFPQAVSPAAFVSSGDLVIGSIAGVEGVLIQNPDQSYTFTPTVAPPAPVSVPAGSLWQPDLTGLNSGPVVIWAGRNNFNNSQQVLSDIAAMVASLPSPKNYVVLGIINADYPGLEYRGDPHYNTIVGINQTLAASYPGHFYDIRTYLVSQYDPSNPQDVIDYGHDVPPSSLKGINPYCAGTLTAPVTSTTQTQISISNYDLCRTLLIGDEKVEITSFSAGLRQPGVATVIRGYAGTAAATYASGTSFMAWDPLHTTNYKACSLIAGAVEAAQRAQPPH